MADQPSEGPRDRLDELLAKQEAGGLSLEEQAELDEVLVDSGEGDRYERLAGELIAHYDAASGETDAPTRLVLERIKAREAGAEASGAAGDSRTAMTPTRRSGGLFGWAIAAMLAIGAAAGYVVLTQQQASVLSDKDRRIAEAEQRLDDNRRIIQTALARADELESELSEAVRTGTALAAQLNEATSALDQAELRIAKLEAPIDPAAVRSNREKLLEVPDTVRLAWSPFDLEGAPAEQRQVTGDVVWNDDLQQGYLRFVGLEPNDPGVEQYQVWVIDERGMEQKVSGGVFNADADGEIIVPIDPAIDVGRVALFAITVEEPGGTWVPDLSRRVVVAPRG